MTPARGPASPVGMRLVLVVALLFPALAVADPWKLGAGLSLSRDGGETSSDGPNPTNFEGSEYVLDYYGAVAELSRIEGPVRYRLFGLGGKVSEPVHTSGWFVGAGGGIDLQICRTSCLGIGLAGSEQLIDYRVGEIFHARFAALVIQASAYVTMPIADFSLTFRIGPRRKWIHDDDHPDEDDPQPGFGAELVLAGSL